MRVLWLSPFSGHRAFAGTGGWVGALAEALRDHSSVELSLAVQSPAQRLGKRVQAGEPTVYDLPVSNGLPGRAGQLLQRHLCGLDEVGAGDLRAAVEDARPDLIHVFGTESGLGSVQESVDLPVLISLQGNLTAYAPRFFGSLTPLDVLRYGQKRRLAAGTSLLHRYKRYHRGAAREQAILRKARYVTGRTCWDREIAERMAPEARYFHCDEIVRGEFAARPPDASIDSDRTQILTTIRSNPYKGLDIVLQAAHELRMRGMRFRWNVAGIRSDEEIAVICRRKFGLEFEENSVRLLGLQDPASLATLLARAHVYVHPSWIDNSPNALCEAMLSGVPAVTTDAGGIPSLLTSGREGLIVRVGDAGSLVSAIEELRSKPEWAGQLADSARRRATLRHDGERVSGVLTDIYAQILKPGSAPEPQKERVR